MNSGTRGVHIDCAQFVQMLLTGDKQARSTEGRLNKAIYNMKTQEAIHYADRRKKPWKICFTAYLFDYDLNKRSKYLFFCVGDGE